MIREFLGGAEFQPCIQGKQGLGFCTCLADAAQIRLNTLGGAPTPPGSKG